MEHVRSGLKEQQYEENLKSLTIGILYQAALDLTSSTNAADANEFLQSEFFQLICDALQVNDTKIYNELLRRSKHGDLK